MDPAKLTITIKQGPPTAPARTAELANDNVDREQELFEQAALRECTRDDLEY